MTDPEPEPQDPPQTTEQAPSEWVETPEYDKLVQELGDPFDGKEPYPAPEFSALFESYQPLTISEQDMVVRMEPIPEPDRSFLNVTLEQVLADAASERESTGRPSPAVSRKQRRLPGRKPKPITK